ncbi:hypothetical protein E5D57_010619 [Metarhizium anisopliae]|nr:hypothetical protein E5D57_010619 [Metarhizium anisopliae]
MDDVSASLRDMFIILPQFGSRLIQGSEFGRDKAETVNAENSYRGSRVWLCAGMRAGVCER